MESEGRHGNRRHNAVGREAIEGLRFLASLPRAGARREKRNLSIGSIPVC